MRIAGGPDLRRHLPGDARNALIAGDIADKELRAPTLLANLRRDGGARLVAIEHDHMRTDCRETKRYATPDAGAATCDHGDFRRRSIHVMWASEN